MDITTLAISVTSTGIKEASAAIGGLSTSAANAEKRILALTAATQQLSTVNSASAAAMAGYMAKLQQQAALLQSIQASSSGAVGSTQALAAAMALLATSLTVLNQQLQNHQQRQRASNEAMDEGKAAARGLSGSLGALWVTYGAFTGMAAGLAIGVALKGIVTVGSDVENTLEGIRVKGGETVASITAIRESVLSLGQGIYGPQQVAKAFETMILAGLNAKQALTGISDALNLATIGGTSIEKSAYTLVQVGTAMGYTTENYSRIADVIAKTAAVSMSSVESLSEAFKAGSAVGKLYGVSLTDIGVSLAALSNLGIQGSAAGTSLKNFYKELASESEKVVSTLASMKLTPASFKDSEGNYKSLLQVVSTLSTGLDGLTGAAQKNAIANLSNERGMKTIVELLDLYRKKSEDATDADGKRVTMFQYLNDQVVQSFGYAAIGSAQMSLTVENQFKSVGNTLKTVFVEAFQAVSPQLSVVASEMKSAFASPEFLTGVTNLAVGVAKFTVAVAENIPLVVKLFEGLLAYKAIGFMVGVFTSIGESVLVLTTAFEALTVASVALQVGMGVLIIALSAAAAAYTYFKAERDAADLSANQKNAIQYSKDYADALDLEAKRLNDQIKLMQNGKSARDAETQSIYAQNLALAGQKRDSAVSEAYTNVAKTKSALNDTSGEDGDAYLMARAKKLQEYNGAVKAATAVRAQADAEYNRVEKSQQAVMAAAASKEQLRLQQEKDAAAANKSKGTGTLGGGPDKAAISDAYGAQIQDFQNQINAQKKLLEQAKAETTSAYKQGLIGERGVIEENYTAEVTAANAIIKLLQSKVDTAVGAENKRQAAMKYTGQIQAEQANIEAAEAARNRANATWMVDSETMVQKAQAATYTAQGKYADAYEAEFGAKRAVRIAGIQADLATEVNAERKAMEQKVLFALEAEQAAGKSQAQEKENLKSFMDLSNTVRNSLKGVQTATEGEGIGEMFTAASKASKVLSENMVELKSRMSKLIDPKDFNEAQAQLTNLAETQRKMWVGVGESISKSLGDAFGSSGKAAGAMVQAYVAASNTSTKMDQDKQAALQETQSMYDAFGVSQENTNKALADINAEYASKEATARIKSYGDMAGAAQGFFKEGSTGYKVLGAAEKAFRVMELAEAVKNFVVKSGLVTGYLAVKVGADAAGAASGAAYTILDVAQAGIRATANGIAAIASSMMALPFPFNLAAGAATAAALLAVGVKVFGGMSGGGADVSEQRQKTQGTGSVLGDDDAKSASIVNSLSILEKNSGVGLVQTNKMVGYLKTVSDSIGNLSSLIVQSTGITGKTGVGSNGSAYDFASSIDKMFGGLISGTIGKIANFIFGGKTTVTDTGFTAAKTTVGAGTFNASQYSDMNREGGLFSSDKQYTDSTSLGSDANGQFSLIVQSMASTLKEASKALGISGDAFNAKLNSFVIDIGKISLKDMTGAEIQDALTAVFSKLGDDMAKFAFTDFTQFQKVGEGMLETITRVATDVMGVKDVFAVLGKSFELTGTAAATVAENLISAAGSLDTLNTNTQYFVDNFLTEAEKMGPITASVQNAMAQLGYSSVTTMDQFKGLVRSLDLTDPASQTLYTTLLALAPQFKESADYATSLAEGTVTLTAAQTKLLDAVTKAKSTLQDSYDSESSAIQSVIDKTKSFIATLSSYKDSLKTGADSPLTNIQKYQEAKKQFDATAVAAANGDATAQANFTAASTTLLSASKVVNASGQAYTDDYNMVQTAIDKLMGSSTVQVDVAQASLDALNKQVQGLIDVNKSVMSVTDAITALQSAIIAGSVGGLSNSQMDTTYTPTASQVAAATPSSSSNTTNFATAQPVVVAIQANTEAILAQTAAQSAQAGVMVGAMYDSSDDNASTVTTGLAGLINKAAAKVALV